MGIESIIGTRAALVLLNILLGLAAFGFVWGVVKLSYQRVTGSPMPRNKLTVTFDVIVETTNNILGAVNKARVSGGAAPLFLPLQPQIEVRDLATGEALTDATPGPGQSGRASVGALALVAAVSVSGLAACPRLPERVGCAEGTRACVEGAPHVCDGDGRYHRAGDLACAAVGGVCVSSEGRAWCAPGPVDGGQSDAADTAEGDDR